MKLLREGHVDVDAVLMKPLFGHLATFSEHGPRDSPVWFLWENACFWVIANMDHDTFPMRIQADPRCAFGVVDFNPMTGRVQHIGARGHGSIEAWDLARAKRKLRRYLGPDESAWDPSVFTLSPRKRLRWVRIRPETMVAREQSFAPSLG